MTKFEEELIKRNERWIAQSKAQITVYQGFINAEKKCIGDLVKQNRELKGRCV